MSVMRTVTINLGRPIPLATVMLFAVVLSTPAMANDGACRQYQLAFLDGVLEAYGPNSDMNWAENAAHKDSTTWNALFVSYQCPLIALNYLSTDTAASKRWISEISTIDVNMVKGGRLLLKALAAKIAEVSSNSVNREIRLDLMTALNRNAKTNSQPSVHQATWCNVLVEGLKRDWSQPDGYLMAVVNNTAISLASCPIPTLDFIGHDQHVLELWIANLDPAVFTPGSNRPVQCSLGTDIVKAVEKARKKLPKSTTAGRISLAVADEVRDCK